MNLSEAIALLLSDPKEFLSTQTLIIAGGGKSAQAAGARFKLESKGGSIWRADFVSNDTSTAGANEFIGWYIPMQQLPGFTANALPTPTQSPIDFAITSQLSGCIFGIGQNGPQTIAAHIQPNQSSHLDVSDEGRRVGHRQADLRAGLTSAGLTEAFGSGGSYNMMKEKVAVVGKRDSTGKWTFWAQSYNNTSREITGLCHTM